MSLKQQQNIEQTTRLSQSQVRFVRLLEMTSADAAAAVARELAENPALTQVETPDAEAPAAPEVSDAALSAVPRRKTYDFYSPADTARSLPDVLDAQLRRMPLEPLMLTAARQVVGSLDSNGWLSRDAAGMATDMEIAEGIAVPEELMERAIALVQTLDPPGVGARSLQETLMLQLRRQLAAYGDTPPDDLRLAMTLVQHHIDALAKHHYDRLRAALHITDGQLRGALERIHRLNPRPGAAFSGGSSQPDTVQPDFEVRKDSDGRIMVSLPGALPELAVEQSFADALADARRRHRAPDKYIASRVADANMYIRVVRQRQLTLMAVASAIVDLQRPYFQSDGDPAKLRPMGLKELAARTGLDISTVSRATSHKYISTPWGILPMRYFFSEAFGGDASGRQIQHALRTLVEAEDKAHPLSDDALCEALRSQGFEVSRRTVSKYRDRLSIPVARLRRQR